MKLRLLGGVIAATLFLSSQAHALSCMRPDIAKTMETAKTSDDLYYILVGTFQSTPPPKTYKPNAPNAPLNGIGEHRVEAWFDGRVLSNNPKYDSPVSRMPIDVDVTCGGPWCGSAPRNGTEVIAFVKARPGQAMLLSAGPCPDKVYRLDPKKSHIKKLRSCFDKPCKADVDPRFDKG